MNQEQELILSTEDKTNKSEIKKPIAHFNSNNIKYGRMKGFLFYNGDPLLVLGPHCNYNRNIKEFRAFLFMFINCYFWSFVLIFYFLMDAF